MLNHLSRTLSDENAEGKNEIKKEWVFSYE